MVRSTRWWAAAVATAVVAASVSLPAVASSTPVSAPSSSAVGQPLASTQGDGLVASTYRVELEPVDDDAHVLEAEPGVFSAVGVVAAPASLPEEATWVRVRAGGAWTEWELLEAANEPEEGSPDDSGAVAERDTTEPMLVAPGTDAAQVRFDDPATAIDDDATRIPADVALVIVVEAPPATSLDSPAPGIEPLVAPVSGGLATSSEAVFTPSGIPPAPVAVNPRSSWGARAPAVTPGTAPGPTLGILHHTVSPNGYGAEQVPSMLRSIQAYHMDANGWWDIAYNFIVDRFGRVWEARSGSLAGNVIGGHSRGFNTGSVGVALLGDFETAAPSTESLVNAGKIMGWRLGAGGTNPLGTVAFRSLGNERFAEGQIVGLNTISGHRDTGSTACPGRYAYAALNTVRAAAIAPYNAVVAALAPVGNFEGYGSGGVGVVRLSGWTADPDDSDPVPVHLYAEVNGQPVASMATVANRFRGDVGAAYPRFGNQRGFSADMAWPWGPGRVCAYAINLRVGFNQPIGCRPVARPTGPPVGALEVAAAGRGDVRLSGWTGDPDTDLPTDAHLYLWRPGAGAPSYGVAVTADRLRPDINAAYPGFSAAHGFEHTFHDVPGGTWTACAWAIDRIGGHPASSLGCRTFAMPAGDALGNHESSEAGPRTVTLNGWAGDPDTDVPNQVHAYLWRRGAASPSRSMAVTADGSRPDVGAAYPGWGDGHGFTATFADVPPGDWVACAFSLNLVGEGTFRDIGCRPVTVATGGPTGNLESVLGANPAPPTDPAGPQVNVGGWALDRDTAESIDVHLYLWRPGASAPAHSAVVSADGGRPDVGAAYPGWGDSHGFRHAFTGIETGSWTLCAWAIDRVGGQPATMLGCRATAVPAT
jgi:hypothetical protein